MRASVDNPELLRLFGGKPDQVGGARLDDRHLAGRARRHPARLDRRPRLLRAHAAGHQRLRRGDARQAQEPAADLRRRDGARTAARRTSPATSRSTASLSQVKNVVPALFLFVVVVALPQAQLRIGQVKGIVSAPLPRLPRTMGWSAGLLLFVALLAGSLSEANLLLVGTAATFAIVMLSLVLLTGYGGHVSLAQLTFAGVGALTYAKIDEPNLYGLLVSALVAAGRRRPGGAARAPADRALPGAGHARVRLDHGQDGLPGRLRLRLQRRCSRPSGSRSSAPRSARPAATSS